MEPSRSQTRQPPAPPGLKTISGVVERITFQDEVTGYIIARLLPDPKPEDADHIRNGDVPSHRAAADEDHLVTIVGTLLGIAAGEALELTGFWHYHPQHRWRFTVHSYRSILPATTQGLRKYLGSGLIPGIGPRSAEKIVDLFGMTTFEVLDRNPERLYEVPGLGPVRAERIVTAWQEQKAIREVVHCLFELGVSTSLAVRIYKQYGDEATTIVQHEPYRLAREVWGIGFKTADKIGQLVGYSPDHPERIKAGILFALSEACNNGGHTYLPRLHLVNQAADLLSVSTEQVNRAITGLVAENGVLVDTLLTQPDGHMAFEPMVIVDVFTQEGLTLEEEQTSNARAFATCIQEQETTVDLEESKHSQGSTYAVPLPISARLLQGMLFREQGQKIPADTQHSRSVHPEEQAIYLPPFHAAEQGVAKHLLRLARCSADQSRLAELQHTKFPAMFEYLVTKAHFQLTEQQQQGIAMALTHPVAILTGGPGTGKTTSMRALIHVLQLKKKRVVLAAPTGRAAKRLAEATGLEAKTLHRLLQLKPSGQPLYSQANPLPADVVIVDEVSMLDILLTNNLLKGIATGTHVLLVGDADQLPSVGAGRVLGDINACNAFPIVRLEQIFRQGAGSAIAMNAQRVNQGQMPVSNLESADFFFVRREDPTQASNLVVDFVAHRIPARFNYHPEDIQVLTPMHKGKCGARELNKQLQAVLNPPSLQKVEKLYGDQIFRVGDKVLQLRNNYEKDVYNGDSGQITAISLEDHTLTVQLDEGREVTYEFGELDELALAYAVSIHKAQGSEYPVCVLPLLMEHYPLLERQLLYTAITRARQLMVLVGSQKALTRAVKNGPRIETGVEEVLAGEEANSSSLHAFFKPWTTRYTGLAVRLRQVV